MKVKVIGAGLAGVESAWQLAERGFEVELCEMKPEKYSPAHKYSGFAELVCSNSLKSSSVDSACGLLKEEMRRLGSLVVPVAEKTAVPAGGALAVNRKDFSDEITRLIRSHPNITVINGEVTEFPEKNAIICTGPLTSDAFAEKIREHFGENGEFMSFYDASAPIVTAESIDRSIAFVQSRYDHGGADYLNCPMNKEEYDAFYNALINAEPAEIHEFDKNPNVYEGCMPVEVLAKRGYDSVRYGCMKPVGLTDPRTGKRPYAAVQLRAENKETTMYNLVGFQTHLKFGEQKRVFSMIPGLENAEFVRYGVMHRNTYICSRTLLDKNFMLKGSENIFFAGQMTGVEGYVESAMSGICAGRALADILSGKEPLNFPPTTMTGALIDYVCDWTDGQYCEFDPMGANMGILPPLEQTFKGKIGKQEKYHALAQRALSDLDKLIRK